MHCRQRDARFVDNLMARTAELAKILVSGDAVVPTGFARVIRTIFEPLYQDFELHNLQRDTTSRKH